MSEKEWAADTARMMKYRDQRDELLKMLKRALGVLVEGPVSIMAQPYGGDYVLVGGQALVDRIEGDSNAR